MTTSSSDQSDDMAPLASVAEQLSDTTPKEYRWFVTYGHGSTLENCYSEFYAETHFKAAGKAFRGTGGKHAFLYSYAEWHASGKPQSEEYALREVPLQPQRRVTPHNEGYL